MDNITNLELILNMLAEATNSEISKEKKPDAIEKNRKIAKHGGTITGNTRKAIEAKSGKKILTCFVRCSTQLKNAYPSIDAGYC